MYMTNTPGLTISATRNSVLCFLLVSGLVSLPSSISMFLCVSIAMRGFSLSTITITAIISIMMLLMPTATTLEAMPITATSTEVVSTTIISSIMTMATVLTQAAMFTTIGQLQSHRATSIMQHLIEVATTDIQSLLLHATTQTVAVQTLTQTTPATTTVVRTEILLLVQHAARMPRIARTVAARLSLLDADNHQTSIKMTVAN